MNEAQIIADLMELVRDMGCVIRKLDDDGDYSELWQNDGGYVPDGRYRAGVEYSRAAAVALPAPAQPVLWQWRRSQDRWTLERTYAFEPAVTCDNTEKRALYAGPVVAFGVKEDAAADQKDAFVAELVAGLRRAEKKRKLDLSALPPGTCPTCMGEGYLGSVKSQRVTDCPDCIGGVKESAR